MSPEKSKICFVAIARDEAPVIERCLDSVSGFIDRVVIMDTGSRDGTPEVVQRWLVRRGIDGEVVHEPWVNFGHNKSLLMRRVHEGLAHGCDFIAWCDCDEVLVNESGSPLTADDKSRFLAFADAHPDGGIFMFETRYGDLRYSRWQVARNDRLYRWHGSVHEWLASDEPTGSVHVDFLFNVARKQGNSARNPLRLHDDIAMLESDLAHQPGEPRTLFYLAQSYEEAGRIERAKELYETRARTEAGYDEERFIALLRLARIHKREGNYSGALPHLSRAIREFPQRLEGWFELMLALDALGLAHEAWSIGSRAPWRDPPTAGALFAEADVYRWRHRFHMGVLAWYAERTALGYQLLRDVASAVPEDTQPLLRSNLGWFERRLHGGPRSIFSGEATADLFVVDDFLDDPDETRRFALAQPFDIIGNYPGARTQAFANDVHREAFAHLLGRRISWWPTAADSYNGSYQYTTADMTTWYHRDRTTHGAVLYLTPHAPPDSGTLFFAHRAHGQGPASPEALAQMDADSNNPDAWILTDQIANRYNRLVIFNGLRTHRAGRFFGSGPHDGRLCQVFFFNVAGD